MTPSCVVVDTPDALRRWLDQPLCCAIGIAITQRLVDDFCRLSGDRQAIHSANRSPAVAPGNLLLSLLPQLAQSTIRVRQFERCLLVQYERVRFLKPVMVNDTIASQLTIRAVKTRTKRVFVRYDCQLKVADQPVLIAALSDIYFCHR